MRRLLWASLPRMLGVTRNPSRRFVLEKPDTSFNTGNAEGFRLSPNNHPTKPGDFAWLRPRACYILRRRPLITSFLTVQLPRRSLAATAPVLPRLFRRRHATTTRPRFASANQRRPGAHAHRRRHRHRALRPLRRLPPPRSATRRRRTPVRRVRRRLWRTPPTSRAHRPAPRPRPLRRPPRRRRAVRRQPPPLPVFAPHAGCSGG